MRLKSLILGCDKDMFINEDFLLQNETSKKLYHEYASSQPIIDYHNHLSPKDIATNRKFENLFDMWIDHDHYKWRAMRANGVPETHCTGNASPKDKFLAFARTVPHTLRNPLFHWTHLELKRFFDIDEMLSDENAESIWDRCNEQIDSRDDLLPRGILRKFNVESLCTTDDPTDTLEYHKALADDASFPVGVFPAFRPDWALFVHMPEEFQAWVGKLESATDSSISSFEEFLNAIDERHEFFHSMGARLSDHGCQYVPSAFCDFDEAKSIFNAAMSGDAAEADQHDKFSTFLLLHLARLDYGKQWTNQFHVGVFRNNNTRLFQLAGRDLGCDSIGDHQQAGTMGRFFDALDSEDRLPRTIVYNLNPSDNYLISTMIGNFQDGRIAGKMQFGSGWWYLDQMEGMLWQLNTLSNTGLLSRFVGMLTDSRSLMSFTRHEYFRRIFCNLLGTEVECGLLPNDLELIGGLVERVCCLNARQFLRLPIKA